MKDTKIEKQKSKSNKELKENENYILAEVNIEEDNINVDIRIINSYEEWLRGHLDWIKDNKYNNEEEIKKCEIKINDELIPFNYKYKFNSKGKYKIKYSFKNNLTKTNHMFFVCELLTNINLSNFNTNNVTNMGWMFNDCSSLTNIDLSNFNTNNVTNMGCMFFWCDSLKKENIITKDNKILSKF